MLLAGKQMEADYIMLNETGQTQKVNITFFVIYKSVNKWKED